MDNDYSQAGILADIQQSIRDQETLKDWWERAHVRDHQVWLTGSQGDDVWQRLEVTDLLKPGVIVLNVGVGFGHCTRQLANMGCIVDVLDIAPAALERVDGFVRNGYLASGLNRLPSDTYDVALSHLVAQHMMDADLQVQIREVVRSLKPNGVFAVQFATSMLPIAPEQTPTSAKGGSNQRSPERVSELVRQVGGRVVLSKAKEQFPDHKAGWHVVHIGRE
jgi:2-polyprenyl-3-methyl-5-hydroxy-6-metoxy-1,4-benzoquinol methylase